MGRTHDAIERYPRLRLAARSWQPAPQPLPHPACCGSPPPTPPIPTSPCASSSPIRRAARPTSWRASSRRCCRRRSAARSSSRTSAAAAATSAWAASRVPIPTATRSCCSTSGFVGQSRPLCDAALRSAQGLRRRSPSSATSPNVIAVLPSLGVKTVKELVALAAQGPGEVQHRDAAGRHLAASGGRDVQAARRASARSPSSFHTGGGQALQALLSGAAQINIGVLGAGASADQGRQASSASPSPATSAGTTCPTCRRWSSSATRTS